MIVWLASYPRSGNTLLRTILHQHFGLDSFSREQGNSEPPGFTKVTREACGHKDISCDWDLFYQQADQSSSMTLIKTHRPPIDRNKAIYILRDGRSAYASYAKYHTSFIKDKTQSLLGLILGLDFYGGWSENYRVWTMAQNPLLILRYENLTAPDQATITAIADFLDLPEPEGNWKNPFAELQKESPDFFRKGCSFWEKTDDWSEFIDSVFFFFHGELMCELGYVNETEFDQAQRRLSPDLKILFNIIRQLIRDFNNCNKVCLDRQAVIDGLKQICDERLALIKSLHDEAEKRMAIIRIMKG
ncbi:MAG: sulfotransferase domain-containing protein [Pseudomonadota bacterium]